MDHPDREYINCPFQEKDQAKSLGARWDWEKKKWYIPRGIANRSDFSRWLEPPSSPGKSPSKLVPLRKITLNDSSQSSPTSSSSTSSSSNVTSSPSKKSFTGSKFYLDVPFYEKDQAKALGAFWDDRERLWFIPAHKDKGPFKKWSLAAKQLAEQSEVERHAVCLRPSTDPEDAIVKCDCNPWEECRCSEFYPKTEEEARKQRNEYANSMMDNKIFDNLTPRDLIEGYCWDWLNDGYCLTSASCTLHHVPPPHWSPERIAEHTSLVNDCKPTVQRILDNPVGNKILVSKNYKKPPTLFTIGASSPSKK